MFAVALVTLFLAAAGCIVLGGYYHQAGRFQERGYAMFLAALLAGIAGFMLLTP